VGTSIVCGTIVGLVVVAEQRIILVNVNFMEMVEGNIEAIF
jgi:hypothetical protein